MGRIVEPPSLQAIIARSHTRLASLLNPNHPQREDLLRLADSSQGYLHWTKFRFKRPFPEDIEREDAWAIVRLHRQAVSKKLPFKSKNGAPVTVALTDGLHAAVRRISAHRSLLQAGVPEQPHADLPENMQTFGLKALIDEAYYSALIEGAVSTRKDAQRMIRRDTPPRDHSERMILNNYLAGRAMSEHWVKEPMTPQLLCEIQRTLTKDTLEDERDWGQFRDGPVHVEDSSTGEVIHTGPEAEELPDRIRRLCDFANYENSDDPVPVLVRASLLHYQLAYDHPFGDGNGRTARWLFLWRLLKCPEYWWIAMLSISRMTNQGKQEYYDAFRYAASDDYDATYLVRQQLQALEKEMERFARFLSRRKELCNHLRKWFSLTSDPNHRQLALLEHALRRRGTAYVQPEHSEFHQVTQPTARKDLEELVEWSMLDRKKGRPVVYSPSNSLVTALNAYRAITPST